MFDPSSAHHVAPFGSDQVALSACPSQRFIRRRTFSPCTSGTTSHNKCTWSIPAALTRYCQPPRPQIIGSSASTNSLCSIVRYRGLNLKRPRSESTRQAFADRNGSPISLCCLSTVGATFPCNRVPYAPNVMCQGVSGGLKCCSGRWSVTGTRGRGRPGSLLRIDVRQMVAELVALGGEITRVVLVHRRHDGDLVDHFQVETAVDKSVGLLRVVGE
jgi:hypothetical protein